MKNESIRDDFKSKNIKKVQEKLDVMKMSKEERKKYERYLMNSAIEYGVIEGKREEMEEKIEKGREEGRKEGIEKGMEKGKRETAKKMLEFGMNAEDVARITGVTVSEIGER